MNNKFKLINISDAGFSLIPGPNQINGIADSQYLEITEYHVDDIFNYLIQYQNINIINNGEDIFGRELIWKNGERFINIHFSTLDGDNKSPWGGCGLAGECYYQDVLDLWEYLKTLYPNTWIQDKNSQVYSLEAFKTIIESI